MNECIVCGTEFEVSNEVEENEIKEVINSLKNKELNGINVQCRIKKRLLNF